MATQSNRPGIVTLDVRSPSATRYTSATATASTTTTSTTTAHKSSNLCTCIGKGVMVTIASLVYLAIRVSSICFFISGAVFLSEEYTDIPDCAKSYRGWGIAMTVIGGLGAFSKQSSDKSSGETSPKALGIAIAIVAIIPGLIAGLGHRDVLDQPTNCDVSSIPKLETWTTWIVVFNAVMTACMLLGSVLLCVAS